MTPTRRRESRRRYLLVWEGTRGDMYTGSSRFWLIAHIRAALRMNTRVERQDTKETL